MRRGWIFLIMVVLLVHQAVEISAVSKKSHKTHKMRSSEESDETTETTEIPKSLELLTDDDVLVAATYTGGQNDIDYTDPADANETQCEFPVIVNETAPNCENIDNLLNIVSQESTTLAQALTLTQNQITALQNTWIFINVTCVQGVYGVQSFDSLNLLEMSSQLTKLDTRARSHLKSSSSMLATVGLLERSGSKALLAGRELMEDAQYCTQEELTQRCDNYLQELNDTIAAHVNFLNNITEKQTYLSQRQTLLTQWNQNNNVYCTCSDNSTYSDALCCSLSPYSTTDRCICLTNYTDEECCGLSQYQGTPSCQCYEDAQNGGNYSLDICCALNTYASSDRCVCYEQFTTDFCCNITEFADNIECTCETNFTTDACCGISPYNNQSVCTCLTVFDTDNCCTVYPDNPQCVCEYDENDDDDDYDSAYCCQISPFNELTRCDCTQNLTAQCCIYAEFSSTQLCQCEQNFDTLTCCNLDYYQNRSECQCLSNFTLDCCSLPDGTYNNDARCVCISQFTEDCCQYDFDLFQNQYVCQCLVQPNGTYPQDCCFQEEWLTDHECMCRKQCAPLEADKGGVDCCDSPRFMYSYPECICPNQKDNAVEPYYCCGYPPYLNNSDWDFDCGCYNQNLGIDTTVDPPRNCCNLTKFSSSSLCKCFSDFDADTCCQFDVFGDNPACTCWNQTADPLSPNNCCDDSRWATDVRCVCPNQTDPLQPNDCCSYSGFAGNHECICQVQTAPINGSSNCCDLAPFNTSQACLCYQQSSPLDGDNNCCGYDPFLNDFECLCYAQAPVLIDPNGYNCCNLTSNADQLECQCQSNFDADQCCLFTEFQDRHECICAAQLGSPTAPEGCCDQPGWATDRVCLCLNQTDALNPMDCCDVDVFANDTNCICKNQTDPIDESTGNNCCQADKFVNSSICLCANPDYQEANPENCCAAGDYPCNCQAQTEDPTQPDNCCGFGDNNQTHLCQCYYQSDPVTSDNNCCDTQYHQTSHECLCLAQGTPLGAIDCCDVYPDTPDCYCKSTNGSLVTGTYNCCNTDLVTGYQNDLECLCQNSFDADQCCNFQEFSGRHECICKNQAGNPTSPVNCCDQDYWAKDLRCLCANQSTNSPLSPHDCCSLSPWSEMTTCQCQQQTEPIVGDLNCCNQKKFHNFHVCKCNRQNESITDCLNCCDVPKFATDLDCQCYNLTSISQNPAYNCCQTDYFNTKLECTCQTSNDSSCCSLPQFYDEAHGCINPDPCQVSYESGAELDLYCCQDERFYTLRNCPCLIQGNSHTPLDCCAWSDTYGTDPYCVCENQTTAIENGNNCCWHDKFDTTHECLCISQQSAIIWTAHPPYNCCDTAQWSGSLECQCQAQKATSLTSPDNCCSLNYFQNHTECLCQTQTDALSPLNCCAYSKFSSTVECQCSQAPDPSQVKGCCALSTYSNTLDCQCKNQQYPTTPLDCCNTSYFSSDPVCECVSNFTIDNCCGVYPTDPRCECQTDFIPSKCCVYQPSNPECALSSTCYSNLTHEIPYTDENNCYETTTNNVVIVDGLIYYNHLIATDHLTIQLLENNGSDVFSINTGALAQYGLNAVDDSNTVYSAELPWEGTFSVHAMIPNDNAQGNATILFSTTHFVVTVAIDEDGNLQYAVEDASGNTVASLEVEIDQPNAGWWAGVGNRAALLSSVIPQKVEIGFQGADCWLSIVSINDQVFQSGVWGCLVPNPQTLCQSVSTTAIDIRLHFGTFYLGYDIISGSANTQNIAYLSNVYLVAGDGETVGRLTPQVTVQPYNPEVQNTNQDGFCVLAFDWNRVSILPDDNTNQCTDVPANSDNGLTLQGITYSHALYYVPPYTDCGTIQPQDSDPAVKTHLCDAQCASVELTAAETQFQLYDILAISNNFDSYNPIISVQDDGTPLVYLVADNEPSIRTIISPPYSFISGLGATFSFSIGFRLASFPYSILNAANPDPVAELVINARIFGQQTFTAVLLIQRTADDNEVFQIVRQLGGTLGNSAGNQTITTSGNVTYSFDATVQFDGTSLTGAFDDALYQNATYANDQLGYTANYNDDASSEIEITIQAFFSPGPQHGYEPLKLTPDRSAVLEVFDLQYNLVNIADSD